MNVQMCLGNIDTSLCDFPDMDGNPGDMTGNPGDIPDGNDDMGGSDPSFPETSIIDGSTAEETIGMLMEGLAGHLEDICQYQGRPQ